MQSSYSHCWPKSLVSNQALYKLCNEEPLSSKVAKQRWLMLAHFLRTHSDAPSPEGIRLRRYWPISLQTPTIGRHCTNLLGTIRADLKQAGRTWTPPHSETTPLPTETCQRPATLAEYQSVKDWWRPPDVAVTTATATNSLLLLYTFIKSIYCILVYRNFWSFEYNL